MNTEQWYLQTVGSDTENAVASRSGIGQTTLNRQRKSGKLSPESVVAIARAYDADPIKGLIVLGLITESDVSRHGAEVLLANIPDKVIAQEVWDRMQEGRVVEPDSDCAPQRPQLVVIDDVDELADAANNVGYDIDAEIEHRFD